MKLNNHTAILAIFCFLFFIPISMAAQGTEIAMGELERMFRILDHIILALALINLFLLLMYWISKKRWLAAPLVLLSLLSLLLGFAAWHDSRWTAVTALISGALAILSIIIKEIFNFRSKA
jgi:hypothetical protein